MFCALEGERGNDFSFLISELQKLISSHTHRLAHPRTELWKGFVTLGTAPPPNFYMEAKKNYLFGLLVTKIARATVHLLQNNRLHLTYQHCPEGPSMTTPRWLSHPLPLLLRHDTHLVLAHITSSWLVLHLFLPLHVPAP